jgi:hypothetical protein
MPGLYRNLGAAWGRIDGTRVERGSLFEPTPEELRTKRYKIAPASQADEAAVESGEVPAPPKTAPREVTEDEVAAYATGGGWYTLPGGVRVQGKAKAIAHLRGD